MTAEDIYDTTYVKQKFMSVDRVQQMLSKRVFHIQLRKSSWKGSNSVTQTNLTILSYTEKEYVSPSSISKRNKNEAEMKVVDVEYGSSSSGLLLEPPTPVKNLKYLPGFGILGD